MFVLLFLIFLASVVQAHQTSLSPSGKELFWANPQVPMVIGTNTTDLTSQQIKTIILNSMAEWNQGSSAKINSASASVNQIKFVENYPYGSAVIGMTQLTYNSAGAIQSAVITLNDDYTFRGSPGLYPSGQVYLGDVVTHEMGHLFGLSHSEVLDSSMFYSSYSGQSSISFDDKTGIRKKYDQGHGVITGYVKGGNNIGILGAHIQAISRRTGESSGVISDETGYFSLGGLDLEDTYYLYVSPVKNTSSLPGYFSNIQDEFCPGKYVGSFYSACGRDSDGRPYGIDVSYLQPVVDVGTVSISCNLRTNLEYDRNKNENRNEIINLWDYSNEQSHERSFVGWFRNRPSEWTQSSWFGDTSDKWSPSDIYSVDLTGFTDLSGSKVLKVALVSYPLGGQLEYEMKIFQNGVEIQDARRKREFQTLTSTHQIDFSSFIELSNNNAANKFEIRLQAKALSSTFAAATFPSLSIFSSETHLPYLMVASLWEWTPNGLQPILDNRPILSDNSACLDAPYTYAVNKARSVEMSTESKVQAGTPGTSCGTIDPPDDGPGGQLPLMITGFLLAMISSTLLKYRKKFLS